MRETPEQAHRRLKQKRYQQKLVKLLQDSDNLDARVIRNTEKLIRQMRAEILTKTVEAQSASMSGVEPGWGPYWHEKLRTSYNGVLEDLGSQFNKDLSKYSIEAVENGGKIADDGLKFAAPGLNFLTNRLDPETVKIASSFSADLITGMKRYQLEDINKQIALSANMREGPAELINRLAVNIDQGPWKAVRYRAEVIARTEIARVQELGRQQRSQQLARANPTITFYEQVLVAPILIWPCRRCDQYDGNVYTLDGQPYIIGKGKKDGPRPIYPIHPNCFTGYTRVKVHGLLERVFRRFYSGPMMRVEFVREDGGSEFLSVTPNHPILTSRGWIPAGQLVEGDNLISNDLSRDLAGGKLDVDNPYTTLQEIYESFSSNSFSERVSGDRRNFHGDGQDGEIDVVTVDSQLLHGIESSRFECLQNGGLVFFDHGQIAFAAQRGILSADLSSCPSCAMLSLREGHLAHGYRVGLGNSPADNTVLLQDIFDSSSGGGVFSGNLQLGDSIQVKSDNLLGELNQVASISTTKVVSINVFEFSGHVYNLQTSTGYYAAAGIPSKNCRCTLVPYVPGFSPAPDQSPEPELSPNEVVLRWNTLAEAWTVEFAPIHGAPLNVIRLPKTVDEEELKEATRKLARNACIDPDTLEFQIHYPGDLNKPTDNKKRAIFTLHELAGYKKPEISQQVKEPEPPIDQLAEAPEGSRWHGVPKSYHTWRGMKDRCLNPNNKDYPRYGGRGITIDPSWMSYEQFRKDMGEPNGNESLDRIDNNKPYSKHNCKWSTKSEQALNRNPRQKRV